MIATEPAGTFNRRTEIASSVPAPMRVSEAVIEGCRRNVEGRTKARVRALVLPLVRWRLQAKEIGEGYHWGFPANARGARIGRFAFIGAGSDLSGPISIGDLTMISKNVQLFGDDHVFDDPKTPMRYAFPKVARPVTVIEADCWVGNGAMIREGVTLRRGTVVAAGAIVTRDTEPYAIMVGVPAKLLRRRFEGEALEKYDRMLYGEGAAS